MITARPAPTVTSGRSASLDEHRCAVTHAFLDVIDAHAVHEPRHGSLNGSTIIVWPALASNFTVKSHASYSGFQGRRAISDVPKKHVKPRAAPRWVEHAAPGGPVRRTPARPRPP